MRWPVSDSELVEQLSLLPMMPREPRVGFKVQEHQVRREPAVAGRHV